MRAIVGSVTGGRVDNPSAAQVPGALLAPAALSILMTTFAMMSALSAVEIGPALNEKDEAYGEEGRRMFRIRGIVSLAEQLSIAVRAISAATSGRLLGRRRDGCSKNGQKKGPRRVSGQGLKGGWMRRVFAVSQV